MATLPQNQNAQKDYLNQKLIESLFLEKAQQVVQADVVCRSDIKTYVKCVSQKRKEIHKGSRLLYA